ncbi:MAG TPA: type II secretion system minor pseudopilin GspK [Steroidobacteraceae bacterium]|nr:type II secretion system minor pseudopilin GspK [Steroidobacteraceae bacterium]
MAMLVAILLVALGTILAAAVAYESAMSARRGTATFSFDEALQISEGAEALAAYGLRAVKQAQKSSAGSNDIYPAQPWAQPVGPLEVVPGVTLEAQLEDMQGRFNLNWLVMPDGTDRPDPIAAAAFTHLLELLGIEPRWTDLVVDWIDRGQTPQPDGAEDSAYLGQNPPYLTANQFITSTSELLALPGFGHERYAKLAPFIAALPPTTKLNICSAKAQVLDAFIPGRTDFSSDPDGLEKNRENAGACFPKPTDYQAAFTPGDYAKVSTRFGTTSDFFRLSSLVTIGTAEFNLYSLLYQDENVGMVRPILRTYSPD